jgi:hypothetical protein
MPLSPPSMDGVLDRPFYFIVVLWGERFRGYFLDYCLPSLLSPGNLPALSTRRPSKFLIATTPADWAAIEATPIFGALRRHVLPELIEIPSCPPGRSGCEHMGIGHKRALEMAFRDAAYATVVTPDCMLSDGSVARLQELAGAGCQLVLAAALRFGEEPFLGALRNMGVLPREPRGVGDLPLTITGRQMAHAAVNGLHSETLAYEWDAPGFLLVVPAAWWRVRGEDGILLHSLSWTPVLLDYGALRSHDASTLDQWTLDGDYLFNNAMHLSDIRIVQDSDELFLASWGPMADRPLAKHPVPGLGKLVAKAQFGASFHSAFFDPFKRRIFFVPIRWHAQPLNGKWKEVEAHAMQELLRYVTPPGESLFSSAGSRAEKVRRTGSRALIVAFVFLRPLFIVLYHPRAIWRRLREAATGDRESMLRVVRYIRLFGLNRS